jgi:two-component system NtrC family response regulator
MEDADKILIVSDSLEPVEQGAYAVARDRSRAAELLEQRSFGAICLDRSSPDATLSDALWLRKRRNRLPVLALVDGAEVRAAAELLDSGIEELVVRDADPAESLVARVEALRARLQPAARPRAAEHVIARAPAMRRALELVARAQRSSAAVLLQGETGTGKEVLARVVHCGGARAGGPFVAINCAAFPETLLESELFGAERGAYTGATRTRSGCFEQAHGGTLFLDEIGETSLGFQVKLLRALQEGVVRPLGSTRELRVDVRVISATNRDLAQCVEAGSFRRDLYYRLNVFPITVPPLRARVEDVVPLVSAALAQRAGEGAPRSVASDAARLLETYEWPGNVRELENEVARVAASAAGAPELTASMLSAQIRGAHPSLPPDRVAEGLRQTMARFEAWVLRRALEQHAGRRIATARALGITREALYKKLRRHGMQ